MDSTEMTVYYSDRGLYSLDGRPIDPVVLKLKPSDTLIEMKKKLSKSGVLVDRIARFIFNGKAIREGIPLAAQGVKDRSYIHGVRQWGGGGS